MLSLISFSVSKALFVYQDDLSMKSLVKVNNIHIIRVLSKVALESLRHTLGIGVGVGLGKPRPSKARPSVYCCLNDILTSIEVPDVVPPAFLVDPMYRLFDGNYVDFIYTIENTTLQCNIRYTKLTVSNEEVAITRIPTAAIINQPLIPYVGAMFWFGPENYLLTIDSISNGMATCIHTDEEDEDHDPVYLPLEDVSVLIANFGRRVQR